METKERRCVVYEHREGGGRFITTYTEGNAYEDNQHHIIVEKDVSEATARLLCDQRQENTINSFLNGLPEELRDPKNDAFIANLIRDAK
jgi:hypothetical protein